MQILTEIGEIGVHVGKETYVLRPSLFAMTHIGEPAEIVTTFVAVMGAASGGEQAKEQLRDALAVLYACSEHDVSSLFGYFDEKSNYVPGAAPVGHILHLARSLIRHGVVGALPPLPRKYEDESEYVAEFVARDHVALAMAHLGMNEHDAWRMTMTSLVGALRAKFPPQESKAPGARAPSKEEHDATMEWFERVEAARKTKQGAH